MATTPSPSIEILLVEDNQADARMVSALLNEANRWYKEQLAGLGYSLLSNYSVRTVSRLDEALAAIAQETLHIILLDLSLPDTQGLESLHKLRAGAPRLPVVVLTGLSDERLALQAVQEGAQDYLVKGDVTGRALARVIRYALERHRLLLELELSRQREVQEREILSLERLSSSDAETSVTAHLFGAEPLRASAPEAFQALVQRYDGILEQALEQQTYKVKHDLREELRHLSDALGQLRAGPRDVVEIHTATITHKAKSHAGPKLQVYVDEGRWVVLELMGHLVAFYRRYYVYSGRRQKAAGRRNSI